MAYSRDTDLQKMLPQIFALGIDGFSEYHQPASDELARDIRRDFLPRQTIIASDDFDPDMLDDDQLRRAACLRVLAWHIFPRLAFELPVTATTTESKIVAGSETPGAKATAATESVTRTDSETGYTSDTESDESVTEGESVSTEEAEASKVVHSTFNYEAAITAYQKLYRQEIDDIFKDGLLYTTTSGTFRIYPRRISEQKRFRR